MNYSHVVQPRTTKYSHILCISATVCGLCDQFSSMAAWLTQWACFLVGLKVNVTAVTVTVIAAGGIVQRFRALRPLIDATLEG